MGSIACRFAAASRYHAGVTTSDPALQRLALILAGGGRRLRVAVAANGRRRDLLAALAGEPALAPAARLAAELAVAEAPRLQERLGGGGWRWLTPDDPSWPELLRHIADPPLGLFVRGTLPGPGRWVAVVGSRRATAYGRQVARLLGEEAGRAGLPLISGMARGVDAAAHEGALAVGGATVAVWGTGPDRVYPPEHRRLAEAIAEGGALVTEYPPGTPPRRHHFPERNRLVAGMSEAVVVVEAAARSGALVTARLALDEGRDVLAVPGSVFSELSLGPNALLRLGARPLVTPRDLIGEQAGSGNPAPEADRVDGILPRGEALAVDDIAARTGSPVTEILTELLQLELGGVVERLPDGRFSRR